MTSSETPSQTHWVVFANPSPIQTPAASQEIREIDALLFEVLVIQAAISGVSPVDFEEFMTRHVETLMRLVFHEPLGTLNRLAFARFKLLYSLY